MENYKIFVKPSAYKELERLPHKIIKLIAKRVASLAEQPRPNGCEKLSGQEQYRIRQGDYRIVYAIDDQLHTVDIVKTAHRRDVYR